MKKSLAKRHKRHTKRGPYKYNEKKRDLIIAAYRSTNGRITSIAKSTGIPRRQLYKIFDAFPKIREEIDDMDAAEIEDLKQEARDKLRENVRAGLQSAIQYALEKEPRKERGKIVINKDEFKGPDIELYLGVNQVVIE